MLPFNIRRSQALPARPGRCHYSTYESPPSATWGTYVNIWSGTSSHRCLPLVLDLLLMITVSQRQRVFTSYRGWSDLAFIVPTESESVGGRHDLVHSTYVRYTDTSSVSKYAMSIQHHPQSPERHQIGIRVNQTITQAYCKYQVGWNGSIADLGCHIHERSVREVNPTLTPDQIVLQQTDLHVDWSG